MLAEEYQAEVRKQVAEIVERLEALGKLMVDHGDGVRAMDVTEAIGYVKASIEEA